MMILVVDDEPLIRDTVAAWLRSAGWTPVCVASPADAQLEVSRATFNLAVIDYRFGIRDEGIRLGERLRRERGVPFVLVSGYLNTPVVVEAMKSGAIDVIDKPLTASRFIPFIQSVMNTLSTNRSPALPATGHQALIYTSEVRFESVAHRWASIVLKPCEALHDPRTVLLWGRAIGSSSGTIEEICRLCGVTAHDSRDLARFLRALARSLQTGLPLREHFYVADERTLDRLFERAQVARDATTVPLAEFFSCQSFVPSTKSCLRTLAHKAANSQYFFHSY